MAKKMYKEMVKEMIIIASKEEPSQQQCASNVCIHLLFFAYKEFNYDMKF
jgi:hypothetical protein